MDNNQETIFAEGMFFNSKHPNSPEFVLGSISFRVDEFVTFIQKHKKADGFVVVDFLRARAKEGETKGKPYFKLNTWTKPAPAAPVAPVDYGNIPGTNQPYPTGEQQDVPDITESDIPF